MVAHVELVYEGGWGDCLLLRFLVTLQLLVQLALLQHVGVSRLSHCCTTTPYGPFAHCKGFFLGTLVFLHSVQLPLESIHILQFSFKIGGR